ncbi:MAG: hypothetical protein ACR2Q4_15340 [Geminicoccaceae bacterium]
MSVIGASLAGAAIFAVAAVWFSLQGWLARRSPSFTLLGEATKMLATGIIATGLCLIGASLAVTAEVASGWISILALFAIPVTFVSIWRSVDVAARSLTGDRTGGVASARRIVDLGQHQNLRTA